MQMWNQQKEISHTLRKLVLLIKVISPTFMKPYLLINRKAYFSLIAAMYHILPELNSTHSTLLTC